MPRILNQSRRLVAAAMLVAATGMLSAQARLLPQVEVSSGGALEMLPSLAIEGQWLIVSVAPSSPPSARLLQALTAWEIESRTARLLIVAEGVTDARPLAEAWSERLPGARWVADPTNAIARSMNLRGAPMVFGVRNQEIVWVLAGVLNDPAMLRDAATSWLANP